MTEGTNKCPVPGCDFETKDPNPRMWPLRLGRHRVTKHGTQEGKVTKKKREKDIADALIKSWRQGLEQLRRMQDLIFKLKDHISDLESALASSEQEKKQLHRENADLRGRVLNYKQQSNKLRQQVVVVPLEERLKPEERALLQRFQEGL